MLRLSLAAVAAIGLLACSADDEPRPDCQLDEGGLRGSAFGGRYAGARAVRGTITVPGGNVVRDDRVDGRSISVACDATSVEVDARVETFRTVAIIRFPRTVEAGTYALEALGAEIVWCNDDASLVGPERCEKSPIDAARPHRAALQGTLVVAPAPDLAGDTACPQAFRITGASVDIDVRFDIDNRPVLWPFRRVPGGAVSRHVALGVLVLLVFGCDAGPPERCNHEGCGSYNEEQAEYTYAQEANGWLSIPSVGRSFTLPGPSVDPLIARDGTMEVRTRGERPSSLGPLRGYLALELPRERGTHPVTGELWVCASENAVLDVIATPTGDIGPGCFERNADVVPGARAALDGTIEVYPPPIDIEVAYAEDTASGIHYRIDTAPGSPADVHVDVVAWQKRTVTRCGAVY